MALAENHLNIVKSTFHFFQEYKLLHPVVSKHERERQKRRKEKEALLEQFDEIEVSWRFPIDCPAPPRLLVRLRGRKRGCAAVFFERFCCEGNDSETPVLGK